MKLPTTPEGDHLAEIIYGQDPENMEFYFDSEGGLTAEAQELLSTIDREGGFV